MCNKREGAYSINEGFSGIRRFKTINLFYKKQLLKIKESCHFDQSLFKMTAFYI